MRSARCDAARQIVPRRARSEALRTSRASA
jgi:hypothetical protein